MYRFNSLRDYDRRLNQLTNEIRWLRKHHCDPHVIIDYEQIKLSYTIEKKEFIEDFFAN